MIFFDNEKKMEEAIYSWLSIAKNVKMAIYSWLSIAKKR